MDLGTIGIICIFLAIGIQIICMSVFKIGDVNLGLPSSWFSGRFSGKDSNGNSIPLREPYREGFHFKFPWWSVKQIDRQVRTYPIVKQEYPVKGGGSVWVSGTIQYRPSFLTLYRYEEVSEEGIKSGLASELDKLIGVDLVTMDMEEAVVRRVELSDKLRESLTRENFLSYGIRHLFGCVVTYAEHSYGIEILKAAIDTIEPVGDLKKARDDKQKEKYQKESETTEWNHYLERMKSLKKEFPDLTDQQLLEAIQVWKGQATKDVKEFNVRGLEEVIEKIFGGRK